MKNRLLAVFVALLFGYAGNAHEGMWLPILLNSLNEAHMQEMGMKMTAEDIYSVNQSSLKDAVLIFGGGCTGEVISDEGLVLTNHHCGYGAIQSHSSVEHDYLKDGFWAMDKSEELPNKGLSVTFIVRMDEVTDRVLEGVDRDLPEEERNTLISANIERIKKDMIGDTHYGAEIKSFYAGNAYYAFLTETFPDVRLVGAPPSSIGKFGFDTDNWVWPRHTGDFSLFRIYAGPDGKPAPYSEDNVPFVPRHHLPVSLDGVMENDFTMIYGFPGTTMEYLPSDAVEYTVNKLNPARIEMRDTSLEIINAAMRSSQELNIKYAAKQSRISNAWKKWIGQNDGLKRLNAIEKKRELEAAFLAEAAREPRTVTYKTYIDQYHNLYDEIEPYALGREMLIELFYYGPEIFRFASGYKALEAAPSDSAFEAIKEKLIQQMDGFYKNYDASVDQQLFEAMVPMYLENMPDYLEPATMQAAFSGKEADAVAAEYFEGSVFDSKEELMALLDKMKYGKVKKLTKDPVYRMSMDLLDTYNSEIRPKYAELNGEIDRVDRFYQAALMEILPEYQVYYPDANFTLRVSYGKAEGYEPVDAVEYEWYTTIDGIIEKMDQSSYEFAVPEKLVELYETNDYGRYADDNGELRVCFLGSNHTTGGNSGSPAIDANGNLIGLNFDRTWESTMSDIMFDPERCRNIMVDIRYVLFIVDKFAGAGHLVDEMTLVHPRELEAQEVTEEAESE